MNKQNINKILNIFLIVLVSGYAIKYFYLLPKFDSGEKAKDFSATLADGDHFSLYDLKGRYILIDFWASWCGPCRKESPDLLSLYLETKNKIYTNASGFDIVTIALELNKESWEKAKQKDGHVWKYQIGEFNKFSGPIAGLYTIRQIPTKYFINPEGFIIMVNPALSEIKSYLSDREVK